MDNLNIYLMAFKKHNKQEAEQRDYCYSWIRNIISDETIFKHRYFENFIKGFEHRYSITEIRSMRYAWRRREQIIMIGLAKRYD